jgi:hypothetical protein
MAKGANSGAVMSRIYASGSPTPIGKQPHSSDFNRIPVPRSGGIGEEGLPTLCPGTPPIIARASCDPVELSFGQQRLWFLAPI